MTTDPMEFIPKPDPRFKEESIRNTLRFYRQQEYGAIPEKKWFFGFSFFDQWKPFAVGALSTVLVVGLFFAQGGTPATQTVAMAKSQDLALLQEMKKVFGDKLEGVVQDGDKIEPILASASSAYTDSEPLIITLRKGDKVVRIISFSGNAVTLPFDNEKISVTGTVTGEGGVIVEGKDFVWSHGKATGAAPGFIDAKPLGTDL